MPLVAYLLTFSTYGTHLPGSESGWVDAQHRLPGSPLRDPDPDLNTDARSRLNHPPWFMNQETRLLTLHAILSVCTHRKWTAHAIHVRTNHVHAVIGGEAKPEKILPTARPTRPAHFGPALAKPPNAVTGQNAAHAISGNRQA